MAGALARRLYRGSLAWVRRQRVQISTFCCRPPIATDCLWTLADQVLLVRLLEWLTLCPNCGLLPQTEHWDTVPPLLESAFCLQFQEYTIPYPEGRGKPPVLAVYSGIALAISGIWLLRSVGWNPSQVAVSKR